jgi:MFS family permease
MTGALANLYVGDRLGRIKTLYIAAIGIIVGTILQAASINYGMMIFARIFNGIFNGMLTSTVPTYQSECSKPERRGPDVMISATVNIFVRALQVTADSRV